MKSYSSSMPPRLGTPVDPQWIWESRLCLQRPACSHAEVESEFSVSGKVLERAAVTLCGDPGHTAPMQTTPAACYVSHGQHHSALPPGTIRAPFQLPEKSPERSCFKPHTELWMVQENPCSPWPCLRGARAGREELGCLSWLQSPTAAPRLSQSTSRVRWARTTPAQEAKGGSQLAPWTTNASS